MSAASSAGSSGGFYIVHKTFVFVLVRFGVCLLWLLNGLVTCWPGPSKAASCFFFFQKKHRSPATPSDFLPDKIASLTVVQIVEHLA